MRGESTPAKREENVKPTPSSLHHLLTLGSAPSASITSPHRPPTPSWLLPPTADSAPGKTNTSSSGVAQTNLKSIGNSTSSSTTSSPSSSSHHLITASAATTLSTQIAALQKEHNPPQTDSVNKHIDKDKTNLQEKTPQQPKFSPQGKAIPPLKNDTSESISRHSGQLLTNQSIVQNNPKQNNVSIANESSIPIGGDGLLLKHSLDGGLIKEGAEKSPNGGVAQLFTEQLGRESEAITSPPNYTLSPELGLEVGEQEVDDHSLNTSLTLGEAEDKWDGEGLAGTAAGQGGKGRPNGPVNENHTSPQNTRDNDSLVEEAFYGKGEDLNVSTAGRRTNVNSTANDTLSGGGGVWGSLEEGGEREEGAFGNSSYVNYNSSMSLEEYDDDEDKDDDEEDGNDEYGSYYYTDGKFTFCIRYFLYFSKYSIVT